MREAITIEYIVLLMTDSHPAALKILHRSLRGISIAVSYTHLTLPTNQCV